MAALVVASLLVFAWNQADSQVEEEEVSAMPRERWNEFDGRWELVAAEFAGLDEVRPLTLSISNGLVSGSDGCNSFGERPDGDMVSTMKGCRGVRGDFARALRAAVITKPEKVGENIVFTTPEATLTYVPWVEVLASELFSILDSDAPNLDSTTIAFEQSGKPLVYKRFIRLEDGGHPAEFYIGYKAPDGLAFHIDLPDEPAASRTFGLLARFYRSSVPSHWAGDVRAALIPDSFLTPSNTALLQHRGELHGNLLIFSEDEQDGDTFVLTNPAGDTTTVAVRSTP